MRLAALAACALLAACFSKPTFNGGNGDGGIDAPIDGPAIDPSAPSRIATGGRHACRIDELQQLICWGSNDHGQIGQRTIVGRNWTGTPGLVTTDKDWTAVAAGLQHTCGIRDGVVYCWGENFHRQTKPSGVEMDVSVPTAITLPARAEKVVAARFTTCAITVDHEVYCWGDLDFAVPLVHPAHPVEPVRLGAARYTEVALSSDHGCALTESGAMHCWGEGEQRQTGRAGIEDVPFSAVGPIDSTEIFTAVSAGGEATCGITGDKKLACWGSANADQLGPDLENGHAFVVVSAAHAYSSVAVGTRHVCAASMGQVYCFGATDLGGLGDGMFRGNDEISSPVMAGMEVGPIAASEDFTCALSSDGMRPCPRWPGGPWPPRDRRCSRRTTTAVLSTAWTSCTAGEPIRRRSSGSSIRVSLRCG